MIARKIARQKQQKDPQSEVISSSRFTHSAHIRWKFVLCNRERNSYSNNEQAWKLCHGEPVLGSTKAPMISNLRSSTGPFPTTSSHKLRKIALKAINSREFFCIRFKNLFRNEKFAYNVNKFIWVRSEKICSSLFFRALLQFTAGIH